MGNYRLVTGMEKGSRDLCLGLRGKVVGVGAVGRNSLMRMWQYLRGRVVGPAAGPLGRSGLMRMWPEGDRRWWKVRLRG
jgi:hypothetical protein